MKRGKVVWLFASYYHRIIGLVVYEQIVASGFTLVDYLPIENSASLFSIHSHLKHKL